MSNPTTEPVVPEADIPIDSLAQIEHLSTRAYNVCRNNGLHSLNSILEHYRRQGTFTKLRGAGRLTEDELVGICRKYLLGEADLGKKDHTPIASTTVWWEEFTPEQMTSIERHFQMRLDLLSSRAKDLLNHLVPRIDKSFVRYDEYFADPLNRRGGPNAGRATMRELLELRDEILEYTRMLHSGLGERKVFEKLTGSWCSRFDLAETVLLPYRQDFIVRRFPLFRFLNDLFTREQGLPARDMLLMRHRYNYMLGGERTTLEELAARLMLTRERIRQLAHGIPAKVRELITSIGPVFEFVNYEAVYGRNRDLIIIDQEFAGYINSREGVSFTSTFYATVFEVYLADTHERIEEDFDGATDYLVHVELADVFDFDEYLRDLARRLQTRIPETYVLAINQHLKNFWRGEDFNLLPRVSAVCELLAREELGIQADVDGYLTIERNTRRKLHEYVAEVLEHAGRPMHVEEIYSVLEEEHPGLSTGSDQIRNTLLRYDRFTRFEASSTYGLREWEGKYAHLKSGTFADIAEQFLMESVAPQHLNDVADHVMQYRSTSRPSVIGTLKADTTGRFQFYPGGMIGLTTKDYAGVDLSFRPVSPRLYENLERLILDNGNAISLSRLMDYVMLHYRMPEAQVLGLFDRAFRDGRLVMSEGEIVSVISDDDTSLMNEDNTGAASSAGKI